MQDCKLYTKRGDGQFVEVPYLVQLDVAHALISQVRIRQHDMYREGINAEQFNYELKTVARISSFLYDAGLTQDVEIYAKDVKKRMEGEAS